MATLEIEIDRLAFLASLYKAQGVVDKKSTINVLSHIRFEPSSDGMLRMMGTDYDVIFDGELRAQVLEGGVACVNGKSLFDVVKSLDAAKLHLRVLDNHWIEVTADRSRFKLAGINPSDFPELSLPDEVAWFTISRGTLKDLVEKTAFSVSNDETRMNLNGVFFQVEPGEGSLARLTMVSTDGHRLSKVTLENVEAQGYGGDRYQAIIHKKGIQEIRRLLEDEVTSIDVGFARGFVLFRSTRVDSEDQSKILGSTTFTVRQIEDTYPDYERVIPPASSVQIEVDRQRMIQAIRRIAVLTSSKTYILRMEVESGSMAFTTSNPDYGEGRDEMDIAYDGDSMVIGFNYVYLLEVLNVIRGDTVMLACSDAFSPTVIRSPTEPGALFVVMPMRI